MKKTYIFDFDGTIADSFSVFVTIYNKIAQTAQLSTVNYQQALEMRNLTAFEILKKLHIPLIKLPYFLYKARQLLVTHQSELQPFLEMVPVLKSLAATVQLGIVTSNSKQVVETFLKKHDLMVFAFIHSEKNLFGKDKALKSVLKTYQLEKKDVVYIGDEVRDIESCKKVDIPIIAVSWGLNSHQLLEKYQPDFLISTPSELLAVYP